MGSLRLRRHLALPGPLALSAALAGATALPAQAEVERGATEYTNAQHSARRLRFFQDAFVADYRSRCSEERPADAATEELLRFYVECNRRDLLRDADERRAVFLRARSVLHDGHADPLVLLAVGDAFFMWAQYEPALDYLERAVAGLVSGSDSAFVRHFAADRLHWCLQFSPEVEEAEAEAAERREALLVEAVADPVFANGNQRFYLELVYEHFDNDIPAKARDFVERLKQVEDAHRYPLLVIDGTCHKSEAWVERGSGFAHTVTDEGWRGFYKHLELAAECLTAAHALEPDFPEAPTAMVTVAKALGAPDEIVKEWFDAAVDAQFDYARAHSTLVYFSLPRWGGSHLQMMQLGREWAATGRFDTLVPDMFRDSLVEMLRDLDATELFSSGIVQKTLKAVHEGYMGEHRDRGARLYEISQQVVVTALGGRSAEAALLYQSMDGDFDEAALRRYGVEREWLMKEIEPHFRPHLPKRVADFDVYEGYADARYDRTYEPKPIPAGPEAPTTAAARIAQGAWTDALCLAAYREHGARDAKWNAEAEGLVGTYGRLVFQRSDAADIAAHRDAAAAVLEAGCDDPLVRYVAGRSCERAGDGDRALELVRQAADGFRASDYPPLFAFWAVRRLEALLRGRSRAAEADALLPEVEELAVAMAADPCFSGQAARYYVNTVIPATELGWGTGPLSESAVRRITENEAVDPWIRHVLAGLYHVAAASREQLFPHPLEDGQALFDHADEAEKQLTAAHALRPDFPEAAAAMVVLRSLVPGRHSGRAWFDRAVDAEMDFEPAYHNFLWCLRPGLGGSVKAMYRFGVECLDTGRFDTRVPLYYLRAVEYIGPHLDNWRWAWSSPDFARRYEILANGMQAARNDDSLVKFLDAGRCMTAWAGGRYAEAAAKWDAAGRRLDPGWLRRLDAEQETVVADLRWALDTKDG